MKYKRGAVFLLAMLLLFTVIGCSKQAKNNTPVVVTVNDSSIHMDEMMYFIYQIERSGNANEEMYQDFFGKSYWETINDKNITNRELAKSNAMEQAVMMDVFYQKAVQAGYKLSSEEQKKILEDTKVIINGWTNDQKLAMGIYEERLAEIRTKLLLSYKYYQDFLDSLEVDEDVATSAIYEEDYPEYEVEYLYVPTVTFDENYDMIPYSKEEKKTAHDIMLKLSKQAKDVSSLLELLPEEETEIEVEASQVTFLKGDNLFGEKFEKEALTLSNGEVSDSIVEEKDGYYIVKMLNNHAKTSYQNAINQAVEAAKKTAFENAYSKIKSEYKIWIQKEVWDPIQIGTLTYDKADKVSTDYFKNTMELLNR